MAADEQPLEDLDATPEEKRLSRIAADIWGVYPVRRAPDGTERPLVWMEERYGFKAGFKARLGDFGVERPPPSSDEKLPEEDGWTPIWAEQELPVDQNGDYKYYPERGEVFYEDGDAVYEDMATALVKALDYEIHGPPPDRGDLSAQGV